MCQFSNSYSHYRSTFNAIDLKIVYQQYLAYYYMIFFCWAAATEFGRRQRQWRRHKINSIRYALHVPILLLAPSAVAVLIRFILSIIQSAQKTHINREWCECVVIRSNNNNTHNNVVRTTAYALHILNTFKFNYIKIKLKKINEMYRRKKKQKIKYREKHTHTFTLNWSINNELYGNIYYVKQSEIIAIIVMWNRCLLLTQCEELANLFASLRSPFAVLRIKSYHSIYWIWMFTYKTKWMYKLASCALLLYWSGVYCANNHNNNNNNRIVIIK